MEVTQAVAAEIGSQRTGVRISPFTVLYDAVEADPEALLVYLLQELDKLNLTYIHLTEPEFTEILDGPIKWTPRYLQFTKGRKTPLVVSGGHTRESGNLAISSGYANLVGYGRPFILNPDLVKRFALGAPLNKLQRYSIYDDYQGRGFADYPFLEDEPERGDGVATRSTSQSRAL